MLLDNLLKVRQFIHDNKVVIKKTNEYNHIQYRYVISEKQGNAIISLRKCMHDS